MCVLESNQWRNFIVTVHQQLKMQFYEHVCLWKWKSAVTFECPTPLIYPHPVLCYQFGREMDCLLAPKINLNCCQHSAPPIRKCQCRTTRVFTKWRNARPHKYGWGTCALQPREAAGQGPPRIEAKLIIIRSRGGPANTFRAVFCSSPFLQHNCSPSCVRHSTETTICDSLTCGACIYELLQWLLLISEAEYPPRTRPAERLIYRAHLRALAFPSHRPVVSNKKPASCRNTSESLK